nr:protein SENESCENCE-ASSOCIATED GENE 21, mitochondrial-like [Ipomoea batatas]
MICFAGGRGPRPRLICFVGVGVGGREPSYLLRRPRLRLICFVGVGGREVVSDLLSSPSYLLRRQRVVRPEVKGDEGHVACLDTIRLSADHTVDDDAGCGTTISALCISLRLTHRKGRSRMAADLRSNFRQNMVAWSNSSNPRDQTKETTGFGSPQRERVKPELNLPPRHHRQFSDGSFYLQRQVRLCFCAGKRRSNAMLKKGGDESGKSTTSWIPDPVTGYYRPESHVNEVDATELRQMLLKNTTRRH